MDHHPVSNRIIHFDFYAIKRGEKVNVEVPVRIIGDSPAVTAGLNMVTVTDTVEVATIPSKIPDHFEVSADSLVDIGDTILVSDIKTEEDVEMLTDP